MPKTPGNFLLRRFIALVIVLSISLQYTLTTNGAGPAQPQQANPPQIILEDPAITPAYKGVCDSAWYSFTNDRGHTTYLTLNVSTASLSTNRGEWKPVFTQDGVYRIEAYIPAHPAIDWICASRNVNRHVISDTLQANYSITYAYGSQVAVRNQAASAGKWVSLGDYPFKAGSAGLVRLTDITSETSYTHTVSFSAMRFTWLKPLSFAVRMPLTIKNGALEATDAWTTGTNDVPRQAFIPGETIRFYAGGMNNTGIESPAHFTWTRAGPCGSSKIYDNTVNLEAGGWSTFQSEIVPDCTGSYTFTLQVNTGLLVSTYNIPYLVNYPSIKVTSGSNIPAFDVCRIPSLATMQTWWLMSPYKTINLYIGGSSLLKTCVDYGPDAFWVAAASKQGWTFIPTWVGPQAPCSYFSKKMTMDVAGARLQGRSEADAAALTLTRFGLIGGGVVYYDLEAYGGSQVTRACRDAVKSFAMGWSERLHELGLKSGFYGGSCSSYLTDFATNTPPLDDVWIASWKAPYQYDPNASLWGIACLSDALWPEHQRLRQYNGDHGEAWGGAYIGMIDSDVMDADIVMLPQNNTIIPLPSLKTEQPVLSSGAQIQAMQLLSAHEGWAISNGDFFWTVDGGSSWSSRTPTDITPGSLVAGTFLDTRQGWLVSNANQGSDITLLKTMDGGRSWQKTTLPASFLNILSPWNKAYLEFIDAQTGWLAVRLVSGSSFSLGALYRTLDGGTTWQPVSLPIAGPVSFSDSQHGWVAGGAGGNELYRTQDGGQTWQPERLLSKEGLPENSYTGLPRVVNGAGWLSITIPDRIQPRVNIYTTKDTGQSWSFAQSIALPTGSLPDSPVAVASLDAGTWLAAMPGVNLNGSILSIPSGITRIEMDPSGTGWALASSGSCNGIKTSLMFDPGSLSDTQQCEQHDILWKTTDHGKTWLEITPK
ncbi:MAG: glycoside hydrolase domain-containing protein [Omnitrophica WOR_2 bacterium]